MKTSWIKSLALGAGALAASLLATPAVAGSPCQYITTGAVLTAAQWNSCFVAKQDNLNYTPVNKAGDGMTGLLTTLAPTASTAGFRLYPGVAPTAPTNGDLWTTSAGLYVRINGATVGPLRDSSSASFAGTSPITVSFPSSVVTYAFDFTVANSFLATQTMRTILAGTTNTYDVGTSATVAAFRTIYAGTSFVGPAGTFTTSVAAGGCTIGSDAMCVTGSATHNGALTVVGGSFGLSGNISAAAWTTSGIRYKNVASTITDTTSSGTVATAYTNVFGANTIAASSSTTYTNYFNTYINDPVVGTNVTMTNKWALGADSAKFGTSNQLTISTTGVLTATNPVFTTPSIGVATGTSLALNGCTIGANALCATGSAAISSTLTSAAHTVTSASATALAIGLNGATNPAFLVDASTALSVTGIKIKSGALAGGVAVSVVTSGTNEPLTIDAAGSGTITLGGTSTGAIVHTRATTLSAALTYGGVALSNAVTGTGNMVLSASPTFTGTPVLGTPTATTLNGNTFTTGTYTLTGVAGKTLTFNKSITIDGTDSTTMTFPSVSATIPRVVASGTLALATSAISSGTCTSAQTASATGTLTTDSFEVTFNGDPVAVTGYAPVTTGGLTIWPYPTADTFNAKVCNPTGASITPGAITLNFRNIR